MHATLYSYYRTTDDIASAGIPLSLACNKPSTRGLSLGARPSERALGNLHGDASEVTGPMLQDLDLCRTEPISGIQPPLGAVWPSPGRKSVDHDLA